MEDLESSWASSVSGEEPVVAWLGEVEWREPFEVCDCKWEFWRWREASSDFWRTQSEKEARM